MTRPNAYGLKCSNCRHFAQEAFPTLSQPGVCDNKQSDHYMHALHCDHPACLEHMQDFHLDIQEVRDERSDRVDRLVEDV